MNHEITPVSVRVPSRSLAVELILYGLALALCSGMTAAQELNLPPVNAAAQARVAELLQEALGPFRPDAEPGRGASHLLSIERGLREASSLMPGRLDLRFGIASSLILQAIQTNSQFDVCVSNALVVYQEIRALDTNGFEAPLLYAAYARASGDNLASDRAVHQLLALDPGRTSEYLERFQRVDTILQMTPSDEPQPDLPRGTEHAIVVLGAALETNGLVKVKLTGRLRQALRMARLYPEAPLVLTGGNPRGGITEAYAMKVWLSNAGVSTNRIHLEDRARDTLGNAVYTAALLEKLGVTHVTVVTSANHIRRGLVNLQEACRQRRLPLVYSTLAAPGEPDLEPCRERLATYRDAIRASGLWAFPGIQR